jgi:hypothetical protein
LVEADTEAPFLPVENVGCALLGDFEAGAFGLDDVEGFEVCSQFLGFRDVFVGGLDLIGLGGLEGVIDAGGTKVDSNHFHGLCADDGGDGDGMSVVVGVGFIGILGVSKIEEALVQAVFVVDAIRAYQLSVNGCKVVSKQ